MEFGDLGANSVIAGQFGDVVLAVDWSLYC